MNADEPITRERWLVEQTLIHAAARGETVNPFMVWETETRTRAEWEAES